MSDFNVTILGCGSASPNLRHFPASQVVNHCGRLFMIDCGEGTQLQLRRYGISFADIHHIFISHLHGDHMLGLPGLLSTMSLNDVTATIHVYMFAEGIEWLRQFVRISYHHTSINIVYHPISRDRQVVYEDDKLTVESFPLYHGVPCVGYLFREKPHKRMMRGDMAEFYNIPPYKRPAIKDGADFVTPDGVVIPNSRLTKDPRPARSYAYCSDTIYHSKVIEAVTGVDVLYHEATYADAMRDKARDRGHSTALQAARVAEQAGAAKLIIGHFSKRYLEPNQLLAEARTVFTNTSAADEGLVFDIER